MLSDSIAERYAQALFQTALEKGAVKVWGTHLKSVMNTILASSFLSRALEHPQIPCEVKKDMLKKVFSESLPPQVLNFLYLLIDKRREGYLESIEKKYDEMVQNYEGSVAVQVTVAVPLTASLKKSLTAALSKYTRRKVLLETRVEPGLIGGVVVRLEGTIIDWSLAGQLEALHERMLHVQFT
ncbi:MAG: ATP synthase F1 subunit delta [Candidatus Eremiobacteraeota bacterium]|nr:ATP synthase F1 subunit delta [Candidatus Eremiobacteraeota bacterium]